MQHDLVEERRWVAKQDYVEGLALSQLSPGPLAAQLAMYLGGVFALSAVVTAATEKEIIWIFLGSGVVAALLKAARARAVTPAALLPWWFLSGIRRPGSEAECIGGVDEVRQTIGLLVDRVLVELRDDRRARCRLRRARESSRRVARERPEQLQ